MSNRLDNESQSCTACSVLYPDCVTENEAARCRGLRQLLEDDLRLPNDFDALRACAHARDGWERPTDDDLHCLDVNKAKQFGLLADGAAGSYCWTSSNGDTASVGVFGGRDAIELVYTATFRGESEEIRDRIGLEWTPCHYGGERPWFRCSDRGRRVARLYGGRLFRCRHCVGLVYASTRERPHYRLLRRAQNLRVRCGGDFNVTKPFPPKPKGMHWATYWRLRCESEDAALGSLLAAAQKFGIDPSP